MKIPETIKIGGHIYKIIRNYKFKERTDLIGQCEHCLQEIRLCEGDMGGKFTETKIEEIFIHELLHCVDEIYNSGSLTKDSEKTIVQLTQGLYQVLKDNELLK